MQELQTTTRATIKELLYRHKYPSRTHLSELIGISNPSITPYVATLLSEGVVEENRDCAEQSTEKANALGRKRITLNLVKDAGFTVGVELTIYGIFICICNLQGDVLTEEVFPSHKEDPYEVLLPALSEIIMNFIKTHRVPEDRILGVGVGVPGFVKDGRVIGSLPLHPWGDVDFAKDLSKALGLETLIVNNVRARALSFGTFPKIDQCEYFAYLFVSAGVACPIVYYGNEITSGTAGAGEIGRSVIDSTDTNTTGFDFSGCLINYVSEKALVFCAKDLLARGKAPILQGIVDKSETIEIREILEAGTLGDVEISALLKKAGSSLGIVIANLINSLNPEVIYIDGYIFSNEIIKTSFFETVDKHIFRLTRENVNICFIPFDKFRGCRSAAFQALREFFILR